MEKVLRLYRFAYLYGITGQGQMQYVCGRISRATLYKEPGSRLAAVVACCCSNLPLRPFFKADKTETPVPGSDTGVLGGRGWIARAALLKTAHWAVFALSSATAPQLFESTLAVPFARQIKQKLRYPLDTGVLGGAKQPKSEPLPSGASLAAISSKVMVFVPSL